MKNKISLILRLPLLAIILMITAAVSSYATPPVKQQFYEVKIYHITDKLQEARVDAYLKDAYLPALHRAGIPIAGVFKPIESDTAFGELIYVFIPFKAIDQFIKLPELLGKDNIYAEAGKSFLDAPYNDPPFKRCESVLLKAYENMPQFKAPKFDTPSSERIYEMRSYESATETKAVKKREMFNQGGEIALFENLKFNAVFYSEVLVGSHMPNLMYMITFSDMKSHDDHWNAFSNSSDWKKLSGMEEYKNTVSKVNSYLLHPASYSDF